MKILKFDGASVGSIENLKQVKKIVEKETAPAIIIVPAIEVVNDKLIDVTSLAEQGDSSYLNEFQYIVDIHNHLIENVIPSSLQEKTKAEIASLHNELENIIKGIFFIKEASPKAFGTILSYAFKISAIIVSSFIDATATTTMRSTPMISVRHGTCSANWATISTTAPHHTATSPSAKSSPTAACC